MDHHSLPNQDCGLCDQNFTVCLYVYNFIKETRLKLPAYCVKANRAPGIL